MSSAEQFESSALEKWATDHLGSISHERRVTCIAANLLDVTSGKRLLDIRHRRLIAWAAIVHDVGRSVNDARHPQIGAKLIAGADSLPLTKADRRALCYLTRYHRGAVPRIGKDDYLKEQDNHRQLHLALAYLRAADALDNRTIESPRLVMRCHRSQLHITVHLVEDSNKARRIFRRRRKLKLLSELLDIELLVQVLSRKANEAAHSVK